MPPPNSVRPRLIACDLDGTLLTGKGVLTEATRAALQQARESGVEVVFATGRRHSFAWKILSPLGLDSETVLISSNGAVTRTFGGAGMHRMGMPAATALLVCRQMKRYRSSLIFTFERAGCGALVVEDVDALHRRIPHWVDANRHEIECVAPLERAFAGGEEPVQAMICGSLQEMKEALAVMAEINDEAEDLGRAISVHRTEYAARDLCIVDLMPNGCSKGNALARLAAQRGMSAAEVVAIGDNMNDADMLAYAGHAVVMENAPAELLALAGQNGWTITGSNETDGAAQAILRILERTGRRSDRRIPAPALVD